MGSFEVDRLVESPLDLARLYDLTRRPLYRRALSWLRDPAAAEDAVHSVFVRIAQRGVEGVVDPEVYLHVALRHEIERRSLAQDSFGSDGLEWVIARDPHDAAAAERVNHALAQLPANQREVVVLHVYGELTFARIAALLETSPNTIASRFRYAKERLSELLDEAD